MNGPAFLRLVKFRQSRVQLVFHLLEPPDDFSLLAEETDDLLMLQLSEFALLFSNLRQLTRERFRDLGASAAELIDVTRQPLLLRERVPFMLSLTANHRGQARHPAQHLKQIAENRHAIEPPNQGRPRESLDTDVAAVALRRETKARQHINLIKSPAPQVFEILP